MRSHPVVPLIMSLQEKRRNTLVEYTLIIAAFIAILLAIVALAQAFQARHVADKAAPHATSYALVRSPSQPV